MAEELIRALQISQSSSSLGIAEYTFGRSLAQALFKKASDSDTGIIKTIFTRDHPASIIRIIEFKEKLSMNKYSAFYGKYFMNDRITAQQIQKLRLEICEKLKQQYNIR